jgi:hypothetical protein
MTLMRIGTLAVCVITLMGIFAGVAGATASNSATYAAALATHPLGADTSLSDPQWAAGRITRDGAPFEDVTTRATAPLKTTAYLLYDAQNLYVGFAVQQPNVPITASQTTNDVGFGLDDFVGIGIDTSGNGATVYYFAATPRGTRYEEASESTRYQPVWHAAARKDGATWKAVLTIPLKALHASGSGSAAWRFNFVRSVAAVGEHYTWAYDGTMQDASTPQWPNFGDSQFWPLLSGISNLASSKGERTRANLYALESAGGNRKLFEQSDGAFAPETPRFTGIDLSYALTNTIHFVTTVNPDFSNVEVDQQSIAPQEFRRVLTEYRPFFAEGNGFLSPSSPSGGAFTPNNQIFYSPDIGPFDRGAKLEGSFGQQSFGLLSFRGYDETTSNEFDDIAYGYTHATPSQTFAYWSDGVLAHHSVAGDDSTLEAGTAFHNLHTGLLGGVDEAFESGSSVLDPGHARSLNVNGEMKKPNYDLFVDWEDVTPNYNPIDGYTQISDTRGWVDALTVSGSSPGIKSYSLAIGSDRFDDDSGAIHQADAIAQLSARVNQLSIGFGPRDGELRSYSLEAPGPLGCGDPSLVRASYSGFPRYYCGQTDRFDQLALTLGYRDGTPAPFDFGAEQGPFGDVFLHQYSLTTARQLGTHVSLSAEYAGTYGRTLSDGQLNSQWLRQLSVGESLGTDSNVSLELRSINGNVDGLTTVPGLNLAASYHRKFSNGNELYVAYGTPAATQTIDRFIVKYILHLGPQT